jgi:argininosuccinate synthase
VTRIALAYSGSLDGSAAIDWLRRRYDAEIVTVTLDLGQGRELEAVRDRALALGALRAHVLDTRDQFAQAFVLPALRADALHAPGVPMALALSRPAIAQKLVEIAGIERADAVAHTGRGADGRSRLDRLLQTIAPALRVIVPVREWGLAPADVIGFAKNHGFAAAGGRSSGFEANVWGRSLRLIPGSDPPGSSHARPQDRPSEPATVEITFTRGAPTALNGVSMPLVELVGSLGTLAATHGVGPVRTDAGLLCDAPAALVLHAAHRELTRVASPADVERFSAHARAAYVELVEEAQWFSPLRAGLDAYFAAAQEPVSGLVRLHLLEGAYSIVATDVSHAPVGAQMLRVVSSAKH